MIIINKLMILYNKILMEILYYIYKINFKNCIKMNT